MFNPNLESTKPDMRAALNRARKELLDLTLRNNFLNYRTLKARGVEFMSDSAPRVASLIEDSSRPFRAVSRPAAEEELDRYLQKRDLAREASNQASTGELVARTEMSLRLGQNDHVLIANATPEELDKRLANTAKLARSMIEEQGVNTLFLALGTLHWKESDTSDRLLRSPLYLVPVTLHPANVLHGYQIRYEGGDIQGNRTLQERLRAESVDIELPEDDLDLETYLNSVAASVSRKPDWKVDFSHVSLGFFSFTRYLMYLDLDVGEWPDEQAVVNHPVVAPLLGEGFGAVADVIRDDLRLDEQPAYDHLHHVLEADSSQSEVVIQALSSDALVVQGPPGTGKSQTIANLLAEALAQDKRVLFVAEKMAALEVVKRRLDEVGLGDTALELHSNKANRASVVQELERTVNLGKPIFPAREDSLRRLRQQRERLNAYSDALHVPINNIDKTPFQLFGELGEINELDVLDPASIGLDVSTKAGAAVADNARDIARRIESWIVSHGPVDSHPFRWIGLTTILPAFERRWPELVSQALASLEQLQRVAESPLSSACGLPADTSDRIRNLIEVCSEAIAILTASAELNLHTPVWRDESRALITAAESAAEAAAELSNNSEYLRSESWTWAAENPEGAQDLYRRLTRRASIFYRWFSREYRDAAAEARTKLRPVGKTGHRELERSLAALSRYAGNARSFHEKAAAWHAVAPDHQDISAAARVSDGVKAICQVHERNPDEKFQGYVTRLDELGLDKVIEEVDRIRQDLIEGTAAMGALASEFEIGGPPETILEWLQTLRDWMAAPQRLAEAAAWNRIHADASEEGLAPLVDSVATGVTSGDGLEARLSAGIARGWLDEVFSERPELANFRVDEHDATVEEFRSLDAAEINSNRVLLAQKHYESIPRLNGLGQAGVILAEFNKKRRHLPIRRLMERAGNVVQAIKPIFMMSPLSVAVYLPRGLVDFDMVVFDEASQVRPSDGLGALLRGKSAIVVGDDKQLPPTSFFDTILEEENPDSEEGLSSDVADMESILGLLGARGAKELMLKWHYRSRHESLIAVSNQEFYEHRLLLFPSPDQGRSDSGILFHHLPNTIYDRGRTRTNRGEAQAVARAVVEHIRARPHLSLGVATFSSAQAHAIEAELEILTRGTETLSDFAKQHPFEGFFVKNLETVQGDERDVIFMSVGYGKDREGRLYYSFGPLNLEGGHRRLNVLITRARIRTEVFVNFTDEDMDPSRIGAFGVLALRTYLRYARTNILDGPAIGDRDDESPFEDQVFHALRQRGHTVHRQVGQAGYFIDVAVSDPQNPGRMVLGIECDGAGYHSSRSARERDRLRQTVLEGLGWRIHRIWSTDWFRNREESLARVEAAIADALLENVGTETAEAATLPVGRADTSPLGTLEREAPTVSDPVGVEVAAYSTADLSSLPRGPQFHELPPSKVAAWLQAVVKVESPVKVEVAGRRVANAYGISRMGRRVRERVNSAVMHGVARGLFEVVEDETLVPPGFDPNEVSPRDRSSLASDERQFVNVPGVEIDAAILMLCQASLGLLETEVASATAQLLGFGRASAAIQRAIDERLIGLLETNRLRKEQAGSSIYLQRM